MNKQATSASSEPTRTHRRRRLVFVAALAVLSAALVASVVLLTTIIVRRRLQQQQQQHDVINDDVSDDVENWDADVSVPRGNDGRRRPSDVGVPVKSTASTPLPRSAVFRALQTDSRPTPHHPASASLGDRGRQRRLPAAAARRRRPAGRRHLRAGRPHRRRHDADGSSSTELRRLARIALKHHLRSSDDERP